MKRKRQSVPIASGQTEVGTAKEPNLEQLRQEFAWSVEDRGSGLFSRLQNNYEARMCWWAGKSPDGRKWTPKRGQDEVFPWPGASDLAVPLVDTYINKMVASLLVVWNRMRTVIHGTEANDDGWARRMTSFWRWMKYTQMKEARAETELFANYMLERGCALMGVFWEKKVQLGYEEVDLETIKLRVAEKVQLAIDQGMTEPTPEMQALADLPDKLFLEEFDAESIELLTQILPEATKKSLAKVPAELRENGSSQYVRPTVIKNRPRLVALACNQDVFMPPDATSMEDARVVFYRELLSETALTEREHSHDWKKEWIDKMLETQKGKVTHGDDLTRPQRGGDAQQRNGRGLVDTQKMFEVIHAYRRLRDEQGVPGIYCTVFNIGLLSEDETPYAKHELLNYAHGEMPFVLGQRERRSRRIDDARGVGEIAGTLQSGIKAEVDQQIDRGSLATIPPSHYPPGEAPDKWGPGVQIPTNRPDQYGFFNPPDYDPQSEKNAVNLRRIGDEYFGFATDPENAQDSMVLKQKLVDDFMDVQKLIDTQGLQLCQQFMDDEFYFRVVGSAQGKALHATREEIQGQFDMNIGFDVRMLDPEHASEVMGLINQALAIDVNGIVDHDEALAYTFEMVEPNLGERLLKPGESASLEQVENERAIFVQLMAGIEVAVKPGQAYQLRLNTLKETLANNAGAQKLIQSNEQVQAAFEARAKALQLQIDQQANAVRGRGGPAFKPKVKA
jgi:hypothetical protein